MLSKIISVGNRVDLVSASKSIFSSLDYPEAGKKVYYSKVYEILDENRIKMSMPIEGSKVVPLGINTRYDACFYTNAGLYQCRINIVERSKEGNVSVMIAEVVTELQKNQRRQYYRLGCTLDISYRIMDEDEIKEFSETDDKDEIAMRKPLIRGIALDISGGGIRFISENKHENHKDVYLRLDMSYGGNKKSYGILGEIIRVEGVKNRIGTYEYRVEYKSIEGLTREEIIKFIFEEERKKRKKERGL